MSLCCCIRVSVVVFFVVRMSVSYYRFCVFIVLLLIMGVMVNGERFVVYFGSLNSGLNMLSSVVSSISFYVVVVVVWGSRMNISVVSMVKMVVVIVWLVLVIVMMWKSFGLLVWNYILIYVVMMVVVIMIIIVVMLMIMKFVS